MQESNRQKSSPRFVAGIVLIAFAVLMLVAVACWITPKGNVDFPCEWFGRPPSLAEAEVDAATRIAYCLSLYPRSRWGGAPYVYGATAEDKVTLSPPVLWHGNLVLERQEKAIIVNGQILQPGETYTRFRWFPSLNPWLVLTVHLKVTNGGILEDHSVATEAVYVSGDVNEGWLPGPLGLIILGVGVWLLVRGVKEQRS
jgi:hypothetical protein